MKTIVVVDDEFDLVEILSTGLSDAGYRVQTASNGVDGLKSIRDHTPDLVLLDFMMPLLDGGEVLRAMQDDPAMAAVPVIMMSSMPESTLRGRCTGYRGFLRKPFDFVTLTRTIQSTLAL